MPFWGASHLSHPSLLIPHRRERNRVHHSCYEAEDSTLGASSAVVIVPLKRAQISLSLYSLDNKCQSIIIGQSTTPEP